MMSQVSQVYCIILSYNITMCKMIIRWYQVVFGKPSRLPYWHLQLYPTGSTWSSLTTKVIVFASSFDVPVLFSVAGDPSDLWCTGLQPWRGKSLRVWWCVEWLLPWHRWRMKSVPKNVEHFAEFMVCIFHARSWAAESDAFNWALLIPFAWV